MNISLAWLLDHLCINNSTIDVDALVKQLIETTAEIEHWYKVSMDLDNQEFFKVVNITSESVSLLMHGIDGKLTIIGAKRNDLLVGDWVLMVRIDEHHYRYATMADLGGQKELMLPSLALHESLYAGGWKQLVEKTDYIFEVDNKSLTHRPDMWGHRGFAREVGALLAIPLKPLDIVTTNVLTDNNRVSSDMTLSLEASACSRFAGIILTEVHNGPTELFMAVRLSRVNSKSINKIVDITNYVMFDIGHPMHAFDADKLPYPSLTMRMGIAGDSLTLLDNTTINLTDQDVVIYNGQVPVSLAGVMGGIHTAVTRDTKKVLLEAAHFDPTTIRKTAIYHKKRTEAAIRFEKNIDSSQNVVAIERFLALCAGQVPYENAGVMVSLGSNSETIIVTIAHERIEKLIGCVIEQSVIVRILESLGFVVTHDTGGAYVIVVPSARATKDIRIVEDIVEEIARFVGYNNIVPRMPLLQSKPLINKTLEYKRGIKNLLIHNQYMRELYSYSLYDEQWLQKVGIVIDNAVHLVNPHSEYAKRLVTSLIPHLLKAIDSNSVNESELRFFEWARVWSLIDDTVLEQEVLSGVFFSKTGEMDYYDAQNAVRAIASFLGLNLKFEQMNLPINFLWQPYQSAYIFFDDCLIGMVGSINTSITSTFTDGVVVAFELYEQPLFAYMSTQRQYIPISKYPVVERDISLLVPLSCTTAEIEASIKNADPLVNDVCLIDFFTKSEWIGQRSLLFRCTFVDHDGTMTKDKIDLVMDTILRVLAPKGVIVR